MRSGRLRHFVKVYERGQFNQPLWNEVTQVWAAIEPPKEPRNARAAGLRLPYVDKVLMRADDKLKNGQLLYLSGRWWEAESFANQDNRGAMLVCSAREFVGFDALYAPLTGAPYNCLAFPIESNVWTGGDLQANERRRSLELLQPTLCHPWCKRGDTITVRGVTHTVDAIDQGSDDGVVLRVLCR